MGLFRKKKKPLFPSREEVMRQEYESLEETAQMLEAVGRLSKEEQKVLAGEDWTL